MITNVDVVDASLTGMREELGDNVARASGENLGQCMGISMVWSLHHTLILDRNQG